jgi:MoxR-like ATPase
VNESDQQPASELRATAAEAPLEPVRTKWQDLIAAIKAELKKLFIGQDELVDGLIAALLANGHVLVESVPGLGKTLLVKALGKLLGLHTNRIQFTPDLMPSDITGTHVFDMAQRQFLFREGPVFTQFLLADELNRSPAKTHAALLEVMQERQVTLDGKRYPLAKPFLVVATQNPIENEGTYTLPEAQLDRFLFKLVLGYPQQGEEEEILGLFLAGRDPYLTLERELASITTSEQVLAMQAAAASVRADPSVIKYITSCVRATRGYPGIHLGASPRAGIAMLAGARAVALGHGRAYVVPDDVIEVALPALRHRIILSPEAEVEGRSADGVLEEVMRGVEVPRR